MLDKSTQTIVNQVQALKMMVDEFRDYARLPAARLAPLRPERPDRGRAAAVRVGDPSARRICSGRRAAAGAGRRDPAAPGVHNLLKNAQEAVGKSGAPDIRVDPAPRMVALPDGEPAVRLVVRDNGSGFSPGCSRVPSSPT
jgi:nitrogen fixation/metabolism regulation signal transduction histidine kinase